MKVMFRLAYPLALLIFTINAHSDRALFYETFEEYDVRNEGVIMPEGVERSRFSGRIAETEMEIEAPAGLNGEPTARWIIDPSGLSLTCLMALDRDDVAESFDFGADGAVTLFESILLDQGDYAGRAVISWMAIPFQTNEPGGTLFPETDSRIDSGPEGLNLIGFGGVSRDFDTGEPIFGADFSGRITSNRGESAEIVDFGVGYEANLPTFFTLIFDLEQSIYDIYINGVLVAEDNPFFDVQGRVGKTLRELEWISSPRGFGDFAYDNILQLDPDAPHSPILFRAPFHAENAPLLPLFIEEFDDNPLGPITGEAPADLPGSRTTIRGAVDVVEDESYRSLSHLQMQPNSEFIARFTPSGDDDPLRYSFVITPESGSSTTIRFANGTALEIKAGGTVSIDQNGDGQTEATPIEVIASLPHWFSIEADPNTSDFDLKMYRATSAVNAQTQQFNALGKLNGELNNAIEIITVSGLITLDNVLIAEQNHSSNGDKTVAYRVVANQDFEAVESGPYLNGGDALTIVEDPSGWSRKSLAVQGTHSISLLENANAQRSVKLNWTVTPNHFQQAGKLVIETESQGEAHRHSVVALLPDGTVGVAMNDTLISSGMLYEVGYRNELSVSLDLLNGYYSLLHNQAEIHSGVLAGRFPATLNSVELSGSEQSDLFYDDFVVIENPTASAYVATEIVKPIVAENATLLFMENFEDNPARSEQVINEFDPRRSGAPIATRSNGTTTLTGDLEGTQVAIGAPSAGSVYVENPQGGFSLKLNDSFAPVDFNEFAPSLPANPISTLRTVPFSLFVPNLAVEPQGQYFSLRWSAAALQTNQTGLALFANTQITDLVVPSSVITIDTPMGEPLFAFGGDGRIWAQTTEGFGPLPFEYAAGRLYRFLLVQDRIAKTYRLWMNEKLVVEETPAVDLFGRQFGWFSTLVNTGDGLEFQQSEIGGGSYLIDDVLAFESQDKTTIEDFVLYE